MLMNKQDARGEECAEQAVPYERREEGCACDLTLAWPGRVEARSVVASNCGQCDCADGQGHTTCGFGVDGGVLAAVWCPLNRFADLYDVDTAMRRGTLFAALDKPFYGEGKEVDCRGNER